MKTLIKFSCLTIFLLTIVHVSSFGQSIYLSGYARDSTTFDLLPYANVHTIHGKPLVAANENGYFTLTIAKGDTIVFTRLGYKPVKVAPTATAWDMNVLLPETIHVLDQVIIYDHYIIHGHEQIQESLKEGAKDASNPIKNQNAVPANSNQMIQTIGAGLVLNGALSKLLGVDKEKRRMSANKAELVRTQVYYEVIMSMQVKEYLMSQFTLTEDEYFKSLEKFKVDYPTAVYVSSREEIIRLMVGSFAVKK